MSGDDRPTAYVPNPRYTREDWDAVSDNPELTDAELAELRPAQEVLPPALFAALSKARPGSGSMTVAVTIAVDRDTVDAFKATGDDWQARMNDALGKAAETLRRGGGTLR